MYPLRRYRTNLGFDWSGNENPIKRHRLKKYMKNYRVEKSMARFGCIYNCHYSLFLLFANHVFPMDSLVMFSQWTRVRVPFEAVGHFTVVRFGLWMRPCMFVPIAWIGVPLITACYGANVGLFSRVRSGVNFQILEPWKALAARVMITTMGSLSGMCSHVYQHFVASIEALSVARAALPKTAVFASFSSNVVFIDMRNQIFQRQEMFAAVVPFALVKFG